MAGNSPNGSTKAVTASPNPSAAMGLSFLIQPCAARNCVSARSFQHTVIYDEVLQMWPSHLHPEATSPISISFRDALADVGTLFLVEPRHAVVSPLDG